MHQVPLVTLFLHTFQVNNEEDEHRPSNHVMFSIFLKKILPVLLQAEAKIKIAMLKKVCFVICLKLHNLIYRSQCKSQGPVHVHVREQRHHACHVRGRKKDNFYTSLKLLFSSHGLQNSVPRFCSQVLTIVIIRKSRVSKTQLMCFSSLLRNYILKLMIFSPFFKRFSVGATKFFNKSYKIVCPTWKT